MKHEIIPAGVVLLLTFGFSVPVEAQIPGPLTFEVTSETFYFDGCDPGTACLVVYCGTISGTLTMEYTGFDGILDHYDVTSVDWNLYRTLCGDSPGPVPEIITGTGFFEIDREPIQSQRLHLDVVGLPISPVSFDSGLVIPTAAFPSFSGFPLVSFPTAESIDLFAELASGPIFTRGDSNDDDSVNVGDVVFSLAALFVTGSPVPGCLDAADANDDGTHDIADALFILGTLFVHGPPIPPPGNCGSDPTADSLDCAQYSSCP